jgi:hypothetical protein
MATTGYGSSATKENDAPYDSFSGGSGGDGDNGRRPGGSSPSSIDSSAPGRQPLSWQRRPTSQSGERPKSRGSRPLSVMAAENAAARSSPQLPASSPAEPSSSSRDAVANMLAGKDPSWFRQGSDRAQTSGALRKNQVEDEDRLDMSSLRSQLPGMSREGAEPRKMEARPESLARAAVGSPLQLTREQRLDPPGPIARERTSLDPPNGEQRETGGRASPTRSASPTKGMGGFVQSAMMKRSDSVKRWNVQSTTGLQRADSVTSNRNSYDQNQTGKRSRPTSMLRDGSTTPTSTSRPGSSHEKPADEPSVTVAALTRAEPIAKSTDEDVEDAALPSSPSKTMDTKRWSPNKNSSWLDAALNKPESPKPKSQSPALQQPAWMADLNKTKAQKAAGDSALPAPTARRHEIVTPSLARSSAPGASTKPANLRSNLASPREDTSSKPTTSDSTSTARPKPDTPPKKDFRANLQARSAPVPSVTAKEGGDDFRNVFGNLRKTKTQNYVAPDELKNNILRGKAGLTITGGPKPREKKDELKEAILKKKEEFKKAQAEGTGVQRSYTLSSAAEKEKRSGDGTVPEGLAKRMELGRAATVNKRDSGTSEGSATASRAGERSSVQSTASVESRGSNGYERPVPAPKPEARAETVSPVLPTLQKETSAPGRLQTKAASSGLASRFNPALAGMLARGPPGMGGASSRETAEESSDTSSGPARNVAEPTAPGPQLTHMTKGRARGPKRKAPSAAGKAVEDVPERVEDPKPVLNEQSTEESRSKTPQKPAALSLNPRPDGPATKPKPLPTPGKEKFSPSPITPAVISLADSSRSVVAEKPAPAGDVISLVDSSAKKWEKPSSPAKPITFGETVRPLPSPNPTATSPKKTFDSTSRPVSRGARPVSVVEIRDEEAPISQPSSPKKLDMKRMSQFLNESNQPSTAPAPEPARARSRSPTKSGRPLPEPVALTDSRQKENVSDAVDSEPVVSVRNGAAMFGGMTSTPSKAATSRPPPLADPAASTPVRRQRSPTKLSSKAPDLAPISPAPLSANISSPTRSPTKYALEVSALLTEFFGPERPRRNYRVDASALVSNRPDTSAPRIRTQSAQLFQYLGEGKKQAVPQHNERVLFEREMYLCSHTFINASGRKMTEVYFWAGDAVPQSTVEDAHIYVSREARNMGGKLVVLSQGKETSEFIAALGGVLIVRRGSSNRYDFLAPSMLCGRRYKGQVVFDEVDFTPSSLCSGFPYLIASNGKCWLWKGRGSTVDELSCARLVGMDLAMTGELVEVEDGEEAAEFWDVFGGQGGEGGVGGVPLSADHWRLKAAHDRYGCRLFRSESGDPKQVSLAPFASYSGSFPKVSGYADMGACPDH